MRNKDVVDFIFEMGQLKRVKHEGWRLAGVEAPESVADHALRAAQIGFFLAKMENYGNPMEVCSILVFHDMEECRVGDVHRVAKRYVDARKEEAVKDQTKNLGDLGKEIHGLWKQMESKGTKAGIIAKDADLLEQAFAAKEYMERNYAFTQDWINNVSKALETGSAKSLLKSLLASRSNDWWQGLKKL